MKVKVALLVDEYFGGAGTKYGGYGFLARHLISRYLPSNDIELDVLLKKDSGKLRLMPKLYVIDGIKVYKLAASIFDFINYVFLKIKNYQVWLSIEMTGHSYHIFRNAPNKDKKLLLWIQDPRPAYEWDVINTVKLFPEKSYWDSKIYEFICEYSKSGNLRFLSQAKFLDQKARDLYRLSDDIPIRYLPNPIEVDSNFEVKNHVKKNWIIFLGRIESVKRGWLFAELARQMPQYDFFMLGQSHRQTDKNNEIMSRYIDVVNLNFVGHVEGNDKETYLRDAKVLVNTSIHEALPISFLEALSYGTLLVSCQDPDGLSSQFGVYTGEVLGDGFDAIDRFISGVSFLIENEEVRHNLAISASEYVKKIHGIRDFQREITNEIKALIKR